MLSRVRLRMKVMLRHLIGGRMHFVLMVMMMLKKLLMLLLGERRGIIG